MEQLTLRCRDSHSGNRSCTKAVPVQGLTPASPGFPPFCLCLPGLTQPSGTVSPVRSRLNIPQVSWAFSLSISFLHPSLTLSFMSTTSLHYNMMILWWALSIPPGLSSSLIHCQVSREMNLGACPETGVCHLAEMSSFFPPVLYDFVKWV